MVIELTDEAIKKLLDKTTENKNIKIGVIKNPPPMPNIPDKKPTAKLKIRIVRMLT